MFKCRATLGAGDTFILRFARVCGLVTGGDRSRHQVPAPLVGCSVIFWKCFQNTHSGPVSSLILVNVKLFSLFSCESEFEACSRIFYSFELGCSEVGVQEGGMSYPGTGPNWFVSSKMNRTRRE